jgi:hypothetical protein
MPHNRKGPTQETDSFDKEYSLVSKETWGDAQVPPPQVQFDLHRGKEQTPPVSPQSCLAGHGRSIQHATYALISDLSQLNSFGATITYMEMLSYIFLDHPGNVLL